MNGFGHTIVHVSVSDGMIPHRDANNLGPSWTVSMGDFEGGLLWVESKEGNTLPPHTAPRLGPGSILMEQNGMRSPQERAS
eukprot:8591605-Prorocentrum_lima.AAC.1